MITVDNGLSGAQSMYTHNVAELRVYCDWTQDSSKTYLCCAAWQNNKDSKLDLHDFLSYACGCHNLLLSLTVMVSTCSHPIISAGSFDSNILWRALNASPG